MDTGPSLAPLLASSSTTVTPGKCPAPVLKGAVLVIVFVLIASAVSLGVAWQTSHSYPVLFSNALLACLLGFRHAVDCDHLAAIDNVTRQLVQNGQQPVTVGFWFAVGHSTIVVAMTGLVAYGYSIAWRMGAVSTTVALVASLLSIVVLFGIGLLNARVAAGLVHEWRCLPLVSAREESAKAQASLRTALTTMPCLRRLFSRIDKPRKMFWIGLLFGLGFDTATQVALLGLAAMSSTQGSVPPAVVMIIPMCFSCGMCLVDSANGLLMLLAYSWATFRPAQTLFYNIIVTSVSALVALLIGTLELLQILAREAGWKGGVWTLIQDVDMSIIGLLIILAFGVTLSMSVIMRAPCLQGVVQDR